MTSRAKQRVRAAVIMALAGVLIVAFGGLAVFTAVMRPGQVEIPPNATSVTLKPGQTAFQVVGETNASVGTWQEVSTPGDHRVAASEIHDRSIGSFGCYTGSSGGCTHTQVLIITAGEPGTTTVQVERCFRG